MKPNNHCPHMSYGWCPECMSTIMINRRGPDPRTERLELLATRIRATYGRDVLRSCGLDDMKESGIVLTINEPGEFVPGTILPSAEKRFSQAELLDNATIKAFTDQIADLAGQRDELLAACQAIVALIDLEATNSYCEFCCKHAPKDASPEGHIIGPIVHAPYCAHVLLRTAIANATVDSVAS